MKKFLLLLVLLPSVGFAQSADEIIQRVDRNQTGSTQKYRATMVIQKGRRQLIKKLTGYTRGNGVKSFMHFTNPEDRGVKYLKLKNELWIYFPDADDTMKISGHMLRQGLMGSDISYEDMMETETIQTLYKATRKKDTTWAGRPCFVINLKAKVGRANYARQVLYVDKTAYLPLKVELYARGGRMIKEIHYSMIKKIGYRYVPMKMTISDRRKRNSRTTIRFSSYVFDVPLRRGAFSRALLRR